MGIFGSVYATLGIGYILAARSPLRNVVWVQIAIARGVAECVFSLVYVAKGIVTFPQGGFSLVVAAAFALGYSLLYPRPVPLPADT